MARQQVEFKGKVLEREFTINGKSIEVDISKGTLDISDLLVKANEAGALGDKISKQAKTIGKDKAKDKIAIKQVNKLLEEANATILSFFNVAVGEDKAYEIIEACRGDMALMAEIMNYITGELKKEK